MIGGSILRFLLHGATNWNSTNFGDFLYAYEIFRYLKTDQNNQVGFYDPSNYFVEYINKQGVSLDSVTFKDADYLVYIPGGYFGEGHAARFRDTAIQWIRFMPFGLKAVRAKKKLIIIGVGAGPINNWYMKVSIRKICKFSVALTARDRESQKALQDLGIDDVPECSDMMLAYDLKEDAKKTEQIQRVNSFIGDSKLLLIHYNHSLEALNKFAEVTNVFTRNHKDYKIVVTSDSILPYENDFFEKFIGLYKGDAFHFIYQDPFELIKLIDMSDVILTCKLHVGVVGCMFNKAVICAAEHPEKTVRFFDLIEQPQNCVSLYESTNELIEEKLESLYNNKLYIPIREREKAMKHWEVIRNILENSYEK